MIWLAKSEFGIMKKSSDWLRQPSLDKKLDQLVQERDCTPAELIPYDAAKALDIEPSGEFYKKVRDWKQRRASESGAPVMEVPPHAHAAFRETVDRFADEAMGAFVRAVRTVGGDLDRAATLRITDAERRADKAQAEANGLLDHWATAETQRDAALARVADLEQMLGDARHREDVMSVRLEERDALLKALRFETARDGAKSATSLEPEGQHVPIDNDTIVGGQVDSETAVAAASTAQTDDQPGTVCRQ